MSITDEFSALKRRVLNKGKNFKANYLNFKGNNNSISVGSTNITSATNGSVKKVGIASIYTTTNKDRQETLPTLPDIRSTHNFSPKKNKDECSEDRKGNLDAVRLSL